MKIFLIIAVLLTSCVTPHPMSSLVTDSCGNVYRVRHFTSLSGSGYTRYIKVNK